MATPATVVLKLDTNVVAFAAGQNKAVDAAKKMRSQVINEFRSLSSDIKSQVADINKSTAGVFSGVSGGALPLLGAASIIGVASQLLKLGDEYTSVENKIQNATRATGDFNEVNDTLYAMSQKVGSSLEDTATEFQSIARVAPQLGVTNTEIERVVQTVQELGLISGRTAQSMANGMQEFAKSLEVGNVSAREIRAIMKDIPALGVEIAKGLGVTTGSLQEMTKTGQLSSEKLFQAVLSRSKQVDQQFSEINQTFQQSFARVSNSVQQAMGMLEKIVPIQAALKKGFNEISEALDGASKSTKDWLAQTETIAGVTISNQQKTTAFWIEFDAQAQTAGLAVETLVKTFAAIPAALGKTNLASIFNGKGIVTDATEKVTQMFGDMQKKFSDGAAKIQTDAQGKIVKALYTVQAAGKATGDGVLTNLGKVDKAAESLAKRQANQFRETIESLEKQNDTMRLTIAGQESQIPLIAAQDQLHKQMNRTLTQQEETTLELTVADNQRLTQGKQLVEFNKAQAQKNAELQDELTTTNQVAQANSQLAKLKEQLSKNGALDTDNAKRLQAAQDAVNKTLMLQIQLKIQADRQEENGAAAAEFTQTRNAAEQYKTTLQDLGLQFGKKIIDQDTYNRLLAQAAEAFAQSAKGGQGYYDRLKQIDDVVSSLAAKSTPLSEFTKQLKDLQAAQNSGIYPAKELSKAQDQLGQNLLENTGSLTQLQSAQVTYKQNTDALTSAVNSGYITQKQYTDAISMNKQTLINTVPAVSDLSNAFSTAFTNGITGAQSFSQVLQSLLQQIIQIATQTLLVQPFIKGLGNAMSGLFTGTPALPAGSSPIAGDIGSLFGLASGGDVKAGQARWVGDAGKELWVPDRDGTIYPMSQVGSAQGGSGGGNGNVIIYNQTDGKATASKQRNAQGGLDDVIEIVKDSFVNDIASGGKLGRAIQRTYSLARPTVKRG